MTNKYYHNIAFHIDRFGFNGMLRDDDMTDKLSTGPDEVREYILESFLAFELF
jgi:hypothetical protein